MKTLYEILNHMYDTPLVSHKKIKRNWKKRREALEEKGIKVSKEDDYSYLQYEIIEQSLRIKEQFEDIYFDTYVRMHDFWYDLTYQERKKQMNVEIARLKETLVSFSVDHQDIFMPCFDVSFNHLYTDEIVLLDLKQYHTFIRTFAAKVELHHYGILPYLNGFCSAHVVAADGDNFVLYHKIVNRLYLYKDGVFAKSLSLHPKLCDNTKENLYAMAEAFLKEDEGVLIELLLQSSFVSKRALTKITNYAKKRSKRMMKTLKKEQKKSKEE